MQTPEIRTQTRLTLRYDDLLLSQVVDPQCEVSWECISPEVVQRIHKDIQRKPNLDIGKMLALIADEDDPPSDSNSDITNIYVKTKSYIPSCKKVTMKRKKLSSRNKKTSEMENLIMKLEVQIANEGKTSVEKVFGKSKPHRITKEKMADESMNCKRTADPSETLKQQHLPNASSQGCDYSDKVLTECPPAVSDLTFCSTKKTTQLPLHQHSDSGTVINDEETTWSDEDLFCDESFIAKMTQVTGTKMIPKINERNPSSRLDDPVTADCQTSSLGFPFSKKQKETKTESSRECFLPEKNLPKLADNNKNRNGIEKKYNNNNNNNGMNVELDIDFSDSDTDVLLSQITEQELCCAMQSPTKENCLTTQKTAAKNLPELVPMVAGETGTVQSNTEIENTSLNSDLDFFNLSSCQKPYPGKSQQSASKKNKVYSFKSTKNNTKSENTSTTCSAPSKLIDIAVPSHLNNSFDDDAFSDKDDDILIFAESLNPIGGQFKGAIPDVKKESSCNIAASKQITPKAKKPVCSKEEIERKKREALIRRKKLGAIKKNNVK